MRPRHARRGPPLEAVPTGAHASNGPLPDTTGESTLDAADGGPVFATPNMLEKSANATLRRHRPLAPSDPTRSGWGVVRDDLGSSTWGGVNTASHGDGGPGRGWPTVTGAMGVAVGCAVAGAASFGLASAFQERAAKAVPREPSLHPRLLVRLLRKRLWLAGMVTLGAGLTCQLVALAFGPVALVQPLGVTSALFGALFATAMARRRLDRAVVLGAVACAGGLALVLGLARPTGGAHELDPRGVLPLAVAFVLAILAALLGSTMWRGEARVLALAVAAGICYGVTAGLLKIVATQVADGGLGAPFAHWALYAACVTGPPGFLLSQNAFQQGRMVAPALAVITTVDPVVAVAVGVGWLGERVTTTPTALAGELVGAAAIVVGVVLLARQGERLRRADGETGVLTGGGARRAAS
jgi:drug/metabolite transporter (DMT)-like permease